MKKQIIIPLLILLSSCNSKSNHVSTEEPAAPKAQSHITQQKVTNADTIKPTEPASTVQKDSLDALIGFWTLKGSDNTTFEIRKSTFYYPEQFKSYKYEIERDSIKIHYDGFDESFGYKFKGKNTLILTGEDGPGEYSRNKK